MGTNMLLFIGIARLYGPEAFGQFATAHVYLTLLLYVADFGLDLLLATEIAKDTVHAQSLMERFLPLKLVLGSMATVAMWGAAFVSGSSPATMVLMAILSLGLLATSLSTFYFAVARGFEQLHHEAVVVSYQQGFLLGALVLLGWARMSLEWLALAFVASRIIGLVLIHRRVTKRLSLTIGRVSFRDSKEALLQGLPWGGNLVFSALFFQLDTLLISGWLGDQSAGIYQSAMKLAVVVLAIPDVLVSALLPVFARLHAESRERWEELGRIASRTMLFLSLPFGMLFMIYSEEILLLIYGGSGYVAAASVLRVLGAVLVVRFGVETFALALTTTRHQNIRMWIVLGATILNFGLNAIMIPRFGIIGAAYVSLTCNILVGLGYVVMAQRVGFWLRLLLDMRTVVAVALSALMGLLLVQYGSGSLVAGLFVIFILCPLACYAAGYSKGERRMVFALPSRIS
jgi:polysaccharide transporter, PST family